MTPTIEQIEQQIADLQKTLEQLKNPKLEVSRQFTGQYFAPYQGIVYRRTESDNIPIWEMYLEAKKEWALLTTKESKEMENRFKKDCIVDPEE